MSTKAKTRSSEAGRVLRELLRGEGFHENISRVSMRSEILHIFGMQPTDFTKRLQEVIVTCNDDMRVRFFANSLNITGSAEGVSLDDRRRHFGKSPSTWVRYETAAAEHLSILLLEYRDATPADNEEPRAVLPVDYSPLERELTQYKEENLRLHDRIEELEAQLDQIHQLSSRL